MFQDIYPHKFDNQFKILSPAAEDCVLVYKGSKIFLINKEIPTFSQLNEEGQKGSFTYLFSIDEKKYFLAEETSFDVDSCFDGNASGFSTREIRYELEEDKVFAMLIGFHLYGWYQRDKYCGCCGKELKRSVTERAMICPNCNNVVYPRISPVIIVGITNGDSLLMTKYADRDYSRYALVAGFMEIGETPEDTVRREVHEEVGLKVKNIKYYKSQPWPYPDSLLMGFFAEVDGDTEVKLLDGELKEGTWFHRKDIPKQDNPFALTSELIETFREGKN